MSSDATTGRAEILADAEAVAHFAADFLTERALATEGPFVIALSGGSTPKRLYEILADTRHVTRFPWHRVQFFFGDERFVPPDDPSSNYNMVNHAMLSHVPIPSGSVHRMPTDGDPAEAARRYQRELQTGYGAQTLQPGRPLFDVVLLGLGENGHTASLFPGTDVLDERTAWVGTCVPHDAPHIRLTLTYPAIASSRMVLFLVAGAGKADVVQRVRSGDETQPSTHVTTEGELIWVMDKAAAGATSHG